MSRARLFAPFFLVLLVPGLASAQRGDDFDSLLAQMNAATQTARWADGLAAAQKLETLVRRQQGADTMNYAGVLHNQGMFLHNLGRYREAADKLNAALAIKLHNKDVASTLRTLQHPVRFADDAGARPRGNVPSGATRPGDWNPGLSGPKTIREWETPWRRWAPWRANKENYQDAAGYFERALGGTPEDDPSESLGNRHGHGQPRRRLWPREGRFDDGEKLLQQALKLLESRTTPRGQVQTRPTMPRPSMISATSTRMPAAIRKPRRRSGGRLPAQ